MDAKSDSDENFERLKERFFSGMKNDPKVREEYLEYLKKQIDQAITEDENEEEKLRFKVDQSFAKSMLKKHLNNMSFFESPLSDGILGLHNKKYNFSDSLANNRFNRIDFSNWQYCTNFLINFCNTFRISSSETEQKREILNSNHFSHTVQFINESIVSPTTFLEVINGNKPLISLWMNIAAFFRKNLFFLILYVQYIKNDSEKKNLDTDFLAKYWLNALISHKLFSGFKACIFLSKDYKKEMEINKLATIKYFNEIVLGNFETILKENSVKNDWILAIRKRYCILFGAVYINCRAEKKTPFPLFSREELEMFIYIMQMNISTSESFPVIFENSIYEILIEEGINPDLLENLSKELSDLDKRSLR